MLSLAVALAAGLGAVSRLVVDRELTGGANARYPLGTLVINVTGSFLLGLTIGLAEHHGLSPRVATVLGAGFAGGYTTLSTFAWETVDLAAFGRRRAALGYAVLSAGLGLAAAAAGLGLARI